MLWQAGPFRHAWDGTSAGSFQLSRWTPQSGLQIVLGEDFEGPLHLGIYFTHGRDVSWSLSAVTERADSTTPIPLPASAMLVAGALSMLPGFGFWRRRAAR